MSGEIYVTSFVFAFYIFHFQRCSYKYMQGSCCWWDPSNYMMMDTCCWGILRSQGIPWDRTNPTVPDTVESHHLIHSGSMGPEWGTRQGYSYRRVPSFQLQNCLMPSWNALSTNLGILLVEINAKQTVWYVILKFCCCCSTLQKLTKIYTVGSWGLL